MGTIKLSAEDLKSAEEWIKSVVKDNGTYFDTCELDGGTWHESVALVVEAETLIASLQANVAMLKRDISTNWGV